MIEPDLGQFTGSGWPFQAYIYGILLHWTSILSIARRSHINNISENYRSRMLDMGWQCL